MLEFTSMFSRCLAYPELTLASGATALGSVLASSYLRRGAYYFWPELLRCFVVCSVTLKPEGMNSVVSAGRSD